MPFGIFKDPNHFDVFGDRFAEDVGDNCRVEPAKLGEFFGHEGPDADILEPDGIDHAAGVSQIRGAGSPAIGSSESPFTTSPPRRFRSTRGANSTP